MGDRCERCDKPVATDADWATVPGGAGENLCWGASACVAVDWRARALAAEKERDALRATPADNAATDALGAIAALCGCPAWEYPGQVVRDAEALRKERDRLQRACDEGLPRESFACPRCGAPHIDGPRHDNPAVDGAKRPHHEHFCPACEHAWERGWTFGVPAGQENAVTLRLRSEGAAGAMANLAALRAVVEEFVAAERDLAKILPPRRTSTEEGRAAVARVLKARAELGAAVEAPSTAVRPDKGLRRARAEGTLAAVALLRERASALPHNDACNIVRHAGCHLLDDAKEHGELAGTWWCGHVHEKHECQERRVRCNCRSTERGAILRAAEAIEATTTKETP